MQKKVIEFNLSQRTKKIAELKAGDIVKIHRKIKEGEKERIQIFEGMVIAIKGRQSSSPTVTVRKVSFGVGVEVILPIFSPQIEKIELIKKAKVRRAKLYYIREKSVKSLRMKYKDMTNSIGKEKTEKEAVKKEEAEKEKKEEIKSEAKGEKVISKETKKKEVLKEEKGEKKS